MALAEKKCCPAGYDYVDSSGYYTDSTGTPVLVLNTPYGTPSFDDVRGHCGQFTNKGWANAVIDPEDCPCCPDGYHYADWLKNQNALPRCINAVAPYTYLNPIPCIACVCEEPPVPEPCEGCVNPGLPIAFTLIENRKICEECNIDEGPRATSDSKFNNFMANFLVDPIIFFKLKR